MIPETYLEYLSLISILKKFDKLSIVNTRFIYNSTIGEYMDLNKIAERITELEKDILKEYICTD